MNLIPFIIMEALIDWHPFLSFDPFVGNAIWSVPVASLVIFLLSFLLVRLIQNIPLFKYIVP